MSSRTMHRGAVRAAMALLALALVTCNDAPTGPDGGTKPVYVFGFTSDMPKGDESPHLVRLGGTDSTIRLALRLPRAMPVTALAYELEMVGTGVTLQSLVPGDLFAGETSLVIEQVTSDEGRHWLGVVSLDAYDRELRGPGTLAVAEFRRTSDQPFVVTVRFDDAGTALYGGEGEASAEPVLGGRLVYREAGVARAP